MYIVIIHFCKLEAETSLKGILELLETPERPGFRRIGSIVRLFKSQDKSKES